MAVSERISYSKVIGLENLVALLKDHRMGKKVVQCHGVFDLLHVGHIKHLNKAKQLGEILIVTLTPDRFINKGPGRPYFSEQLRAEAIAALSCVDFVVINSWPTAVEAIDLIKPNIYIKGADYKDASKDITGKITEEENAVKKNGGSIFYTEEMTFSSSTLLNQYFPIHSEEITKYLNQFKKKYSFDQVVNYLDRALALKVLVIGEAIIDIYDFCDAIGKSGKEPVLVAKHDHTETYIGGALAVANHINDFCDSITCWTSLGETAEYETFILEKLLNKVELKALYKKSSPTIVKRRLVEKYLKQKLFEVYHINDEAISSEQEVEFITSLEKNIKNYDVVITADYGHGFLGNKTIDFLSKESKFLAVNTQTNAGNHGFNCISKYPDADYVCIASRELDLSFRQRHLSPKENLKLLIEEFGYKNAVITSGSSGMLVYDHKEGLHEIPAFTHQVKDRVGAGDAVLAITSLLVACGAPAEIVGFVGNVVGAQAVNIMGNESFISKMLLIKYIMHLLK